MDELQQRILAIASQVPEYVGYKAKEQRREEDRLVRRQLAQRYEEQRTRLNRITRQAPLDRVNDLENLDQKLQRLLARMRTAMGGYAGWFDAGQIVEDDLSLLTKYDETLADGVSQVKSALDRLSDALKTKGDVAGEINTIAELFDTLNQQFDQRDQFLSMGKKPSLELPVPVPTSPLEALAKKPQPSVDFQSVANLKIRDAVSYSRVDYIVTGRITYSTSTGAFYALLLEDNHQQMWLRVGPSERVSICGEAALPVPKPPPGTLEYDGQSYSRQEAGTASIVVEGAGGSKRGMAEYAHYIGPGQMELWAETISGNDRVMAGTLVDPSEITVYRR